VTPAPAMVVDRLCAVTYFVVQSQNRMSTFVHSGKTPRRSLWKAPAIVTALILLIPLLGNQFVEGWNWQPGAFVLAGLLLFGTALTYQLITRNVDTVAYRAALGVALVTAFVLVWMNFIQAADDINPDAVMYLVVPLVGIIGAAIARFQPKGMARALFATALAQALVLAIALMTRNPQGTSWTAPVLRGFALNAVFVLLFFGSALLFRTAAREKPAPAVA
jgi:hypothetical protein